ncbi:Cl- channel voltage-gated family protein [Methanobacterium lacus]|uniref:Cl-channel voltage-gated family protein n=2 Tax=Methanobacterium lacus (strain AL-21) TaxID=877455 RepID=F0T8Z6_METLA|nr:Cl- channel voltage-gated family protein [Methanobacterium lacus]
MGWGLLLGLIGGISALIFVVLMNFGQSFFVPHITQNWTPFSGPWWIVLLMTGVGVIIGLIHRYTPAKEMDVFGSFDKGYLDPKPMPSSVFASLISIIGGFSLGPEVSTGMLSGGLASWISKKRNLDPEITKTNYLSSVSGAWSGLFTSPLAMILILLETKHKQSVLYYGTLLIAGLAAVIGFSIFYASQGFNYSSLLGILSPPEYHLEIWHLGVAIIMGIIAVPVALLFVVFTKIFDRLIKPLDKKPVIRSTIGGLLLGLLVFALPVTLGLGTTSMLLVYQNAAEIGAVLLLIFAIAKMAALTGALRFGFIGGPIFPLLFTGSCMGALIHLIFPAVPVGLAMGCMIVAVPAAIVPIPFALAAIGIIIIGVSPQDALPIIIAALVAFSTTRGFILKGEEVETV